MFDQEQIWNGLLPEFGSSQYVLASGIELLRAPHFARNRDAVLATVAVGVEKLEKLALGIMAVELGHGWPRMNGNGWGHNVAVMDKRVRAALHEQLSDGRPAPYISQLLCTVDRDAVWLGIAEALEVYATQGRFYNLDAIAGIEQPRGNPLRLWEAAEQLALDRDPELKSAIGDDDFERRLNAALADSIYRWWAMVSLAGMHGVLGGDWGKKFGADLLPKGALKVAIDPICQGAG